MSTATDTNTVTVHIPTPLRAYTGDQATVAVSGATVGAALQTLVTEYPNLKANLYNEDGDLRQYVNIYLGDEDIRYRDGVDTPLDEDAELSIVPSIAGGRVDC